MATFTDPADELARTCDRIIGAASMGRGDQTVASVVGVAPWSKEYFQVVFCLVEQADRVYDILRQQGLSESFLGRASTHLNEIKRAFTPEVSLMSWDMSGATRDVLRQHVGSLAMLSPTVSRSSQYPLLHEIEIVALLEDIDQLLDWLRTHQLEEHDTLRAALVEGLEVYRVRLERIGWLGWSYSAEALRVTIGAYLAVERGHTSTDAAPITEAALIKLGEFFGKIWRYAGTVSDATDRVGNAIKLYGLVSAVRDSSPIVAALTLHIGN